MASALLLIAHGSRRDEANQDLHTLAAQLLSLGHYPIVQPAFLELAEPSIDRAADRCVAAGATKVILLPYFLSAGVHVQRDLAAARDELAERYPQVPFLLAEPLGRHPLLVDIVLDRARHAEKE